MSSLQPGRDGDPVPDGTLVFRLAKDSQLSPEALELGKVPEILFKPSPEDERSPGRRLSIWIEEMTLPDQAWAIMGCHPDRKHVACLSTGSIKGVAPPSPFNPLSVEWEQAKHPDGSPNTSPGAAGHVGIAGLSQGGKGTQDSKRRKAIRSKLADASSLSPVPVPHDIPEENILVASYYVYLRRCHGSSSQEEDWVQAVRQLRRERAKQQRRASRSIATVELVRETLVD